MMVQANLLDLTLYLLVLINPTSKVFILTDIAKRNHARQLYQVSVKSSIIALCLLWISAIAGDVLLQRVFRVEMYSLRIAGGAIIFYMGMKAVLKGIFFEMTERTKLEDMSIVPIASPLIAGPATITAAITLPAEYGYLMTAGAILCAVALNFVIMLGSKYIGKYLIQHNVMGALIRLTGLIVAAIAAQMFFAGVSDWYHLEILVKQVV